MCDLLKKKYLNDVCYFCYSLDQTYIVSCRMKNDYILQITNPNIKCLMIDVDCFRCKYGLRIMGKCDFDFGILANLPTNIECLTIYKLSLFNEPVDYLPSSLKKINFNDYFNTEVENLPHGLDTIKFGWEFNQKVENLPNTLETLWFGAYFNQNITNLPRNIKTLIFGREFNNPIDNLPPNLNILIFGNFFNHSIDNIPDTIKILCLGDSFETKLNKLPTSLEKIFIGKYSRTKHKVYNMLEKNIPSSEFYTCDIASDENIYKYHDL